MEQFNNLSEGGTELSLHEAYTMIFTTYPDVVGVDEMCKMLGNLGKKSAYTLLRNGDIYYLQNSGGKGYRIPKMSIIKYILKNNNGEVVA